MKSVSHFGFIAPFRENHQPTALERCEKSLEPAEAQYYTDEKSRLLRTSIIQAVAFAALAIGAFILCGIFGVGSIIVSLVTAGALIGAVAMGRFFISPNGDKRKAAKESADLLNDFQYFYDRGELTPREVPKKVETEQKETPVEGVDQEQPPIEYVTIRFTNVTNEARLRRILQRESSQKHPFEELASEKPDQINISFPAVNLARLKYTLFQAKMKNYTIDGARQSLQSLAPAAFVERCHEIGFEDNELLEALQRTSPNEGEDAPPIEATIALRPLVAQYEYFQARKTQQKDTLKACEKNHAEYEEEANEILAEYKDRYLTDIQECPSPQALALAKKINENRKTQWDAQENYLKLKVQAAFAYALIQRPDFKSTFEGIAHLNQRTAETLLLPNLKIHEVISFRSFDPENPIPGITRANLVGGVIPIEATEAEEEKVKTKTLSERFIAAIDAREMATKAAEEKLRAQTAEQGGSGNNA